MKKCSKCKEYKEIFVFYKGSPNSHFKDGIKSWCKVCSNKASREHYLRNRKQILNELKKKTYGITEADYYKMVENQNGVCSICKRAEGIRRNSVKRALVVDHCHKTGKVRGLLCNSCNIGIGMLKDNYLLLLEASKYIQKYDR